MNWDKFNWDIDGDGTTSAGLNFVVGDITSAKVTSATKLTIILATSGQTKITDALAAGFGADAIGADAANTTDNVDILAGFISDDTGNASITDAVTNAPVSYNDDLTLAIASTFHNHA